MGDNKVTYASSGVDTEKADALVARIKHHAKKTIRPELLSGVGGFNSLAKIPQGYTEPVLVTCTDGVGTKLRLAIQHDAYTIGQDLVAMCVNDLIVCGAEPFLFLDYYSTGKLDNDKAEKVIASIAHACKLAGCTLAGGETAEMPGMYANGDYDLAGFCVGVVEQSKIRDGTSLTPGMSLIALASSGCHSNGYSLVRKLLSQVDASTIKLDNLPLIDWLLKPTLLYVDALRCLEEEGLTVHAAANITGGGITDNLPRMLPNNFQAQIDCTSWSFNALFSWLQEQSHLSKEEMLQIFNCGAGMIIAVENNQTDKTIARLAACEYQSWHIGSVQAKTSSQDPSLLYV